MTFWRWPFKDERMLVNPHDLNQIGLRNELLRHQIEEIEHGLRQVDSFRESFKEIVYPITGVLEELEATRSQFEESQAKLGVATDSLSDLHQQHFALTGEFEGVRSRLDAATQEKGDLERRLKLVEFALEERSSAADQKTQELDAAHMQLHGEARKLEEALAELQAVKADLDDKYRAAADYEQALTGASDRNSLLLQEVDSLRRANEGHIEQITKHLRRESDLESELDMARGQIGELKAALAQSEVAQGMSRLRHEEHVDRLTAEHASAVGQLEALEDRATTFERLLAEARQQLGAKVGEGRGLELKLHEHATRVAALEKKLSSLQGDLSDAEMKLSQSEASRQTLIERSKALVKSMESKSAAADKAEARIQYLNSRLEDFAQKLQDQRSQAEAQILRLTEELEKERSERVLASGALQASRRARLHMPAEPVEDQGRDANTYYAAPHDSRLPASQNAAEIRPADPRVVELRLTEQAIDKELGPRDSDLKAKAS